MDAAFLQASLFTSVVAFGVAVMAAGLGLALIFVGLALRSLAAAHHRSTLRTRSRDLIDVQASGQHPAVRPARRPGQLRFGAA